MIKIDKTGRIFSDEERKNYICQAYETMQNLKRDIVETYTGIATITTTKDIYSINSVSIDNIELVNGGVEEQINKSETPSHYYQSSSNTISVNSTGSHTYTITYRPYNTLSEDADRLDIDNKYTNSLLQYALYLAYTDIGKDNLSIIHYNQYKKMMSSFPSSISMDFTTL